MVITADELEQLEVQLRSRLQDNLLPILTVLNRTDRLADFLEMIGLKDLLHPKPEHYCSTKSGIILVLGGCNVKEEKMQGVLKDLRINKNRLECYLDYDKAKSFNYRSIQYKPKYAMILVGNMGHKAKDIGDYSSAIAMMEQEEGFSPVIRLGTNGLKITKSNFYEAIKNAIDTGMLKPDVSI